MSITGIRNSLAITLLVSASGIAYAQSDSREVQLLVARNLPASPERFSGLCDGSVEAAICCGGYLTGLMNSPGVGEFHPCHPPVDVERFLYEGAWGVTTGWLRRQPPDSVVRRKDAIRNALNELEGCDL
jgi:hypothetical protein